MLKLAQPKYDRTIVRVLGVSSSVAGAQPDLSRIFHS